MCDVLLKCEGGVQVRSKVIVGGVGEEELGKLNCPVFELL